MAGHRVIFQHRLHLCGETIKPLRMSVIHRQPARFWCLLAGGYHFLYLSCDDPYDFARLLHHTHGSARYRFGMDFRFYAEHRL